MLIAILDMLKQSPLDMEHFVRLVAAVILGGFIGLERELRDKPAGFRTIVLICVGACLFTIVSQVMGGPDWNSTRIAAQIVTGIGFLGAGAILRDRRAVLGLTTAATIWAVAAIGMAAGFGLLVLAILGTVTILVALFAFDVIEHWIGAYRDIQEHHFSAPNTDDAMDRVQAMFKEVNLQARKRTCYEEDDRLVFHVRAMGAKANHERLRKSLAGSEEYKLRRS